jgi:hypothetical protein
MAWISLTAQNFKDRLLKAEYDALSAVGLYEGRTWADVLEDELTSTINHVRGYCPSTTSRGDGVTIPEELKDATLAVVRMKFFTRFPKLAALWTEGRNQEYLQALELFKLWASKRYHVAAPETAAPTTDQAGAPGAASIIPNPRLADRAAMNGL